MQRRCNAVTATALQTNLAAAWNADTRPCMGEAGVRLKAPARTPARSGVRPTQTLLDRLPGVVILELCWAQVAERGVQSAGVVDLIDKAWKERPDVFESFSARCYSRNKRAAQEP